MVISFSVKEAREQLLDKGVVYTYRWKRRTFFRNLLGTKENTWANSKRLGKKIADVCIEEIGQMSHSIPNLEPYYPESGFDECWKWQDKILHILPSPKHPEGWLYKVTLRDG